MRVERPVILLLENDDADVFMFRRALSRLGYMGTLRPVTGVAEAISYLTTQGSDEDCSYSPKPDLIVCDLKLFASTGTELLLWVRNQDEFRSIPVVMLSGSSLPADRVRARDLGAREFFIKSGDIDEMTERVGGILKHMPI
jgi:CheY-like chemotaxis protein